MTDPTPDVPTLRRLLAGATPGPWRADLYDDGRAWIDMPSIDGHGLSLHGFGSDAALIAAAVNALPGILDRLEAAEGAVARVEALADDWLADGMANQTKVACARSLRAALAEVTP